MFKVELTKEEIMFLIGTIRLAKVDAEKIQNLGSEYPDLKASAVDDLAKLNAIHQKLSDAYADQWLSVARLEE